MSFPSDVGGELARVDGPGPIQVAAASVRTVQLARSRDAAAQVPQGVTSFAGYIRDRLRPPAFHTVTLSDGRTEPAGAQAAGRRGQDVPMALSGLPREASEIWGRSVLLAAAVPVSAGVCRWCIARMNAHVSGDLPPRNDQATRVLLGSPPCAKDAAVLVDERAQHRARLAALAQQEERARRARTDAIVAAAIGPSRMRSPARPAVAQVKAGRAAPDNSLASRVLAAVDRAGAISPKTVRAALHLPPGSAKNTLDSLVRMGVLRRRDGDGLYVRAGAR
ncbi:hypothetical protein [Streptacidiphilus sp. PAMC 29251]